MTRYIRNKIAPDLVIFGDYVRAKVVIYSILKKKEELSILQNEAKEKEETKVLGKSHRESVK